MMEKDDNTMDNYDELSHIAEEPSVGEGLKQKKSVLKKEKKLLEMWFYSLFVSLVSLTALPFFRILDSESIKSSILSVLGSSELAFVAVMLSITATNDISTFSGRKQRWIKIHQIFILLGAIIYSAISIVEYKSNGTYNTNFAIACNMIFLPLTILLGIASYLKD